MYARVYAFRIAYRRDTYYTYIYFAKLPYILLRILFRVISTEQRYEFHSETTDKTEIMQIGRFND